MGSEPKLENKDKITNIHLKTNSNSNRNEFGQGSNNDYVEQGENDIMAMTYSS